MEKKDFRYIVRIANTDLDGKKQISIALKKIKGVGYVFANAACQVTGVDKSTKTGELTDKQVDLLNTALTKPEEYKIPSWLYNRRRDYETGKDTHNLGADLRFSLENDIKRLKMIKSYRGIRHGLRLPLRGQRTKSNFRRNKGKSSLGVKRKQAKK